MKHILIGSIVAAAFLFGAAPRSHAEILFSATRTGAVVYGGYFYYVDFNGNSPGGTSHTFSTTERNTPIVIIFNAEAACGGSPFNWVDIDILVNPAGAPGEFAVPPTNGDNAFVSGNTTDSNFLNGGDGWVSASAVATTVIANPGVHTVRVKVNGAQQSNISRFDDMSLIVMK